MYVAPSSVCDVTEYILFDRKQKNSNQRAGSMRSDV